MAIDICRTNRKTGESEFSTICTASQYRELWEPAIGKLRLPMLDCLPALELTKEFTSQFILEVRELRQWAGTQHNDARVRKMLESIEEVLRIVESTDLDEYDISFG